MSQRTIKVKVIGMSGQGKSTFLNVLAKKECEDSDDEEPDPFVTGGCGESVTKKCLTMKFTMDVDGREYSVELTDTMGFPDPCVSKAREFYDQVVEECNKECNAIVWVHKAERKNFAIYEQLSVLMREFNSAGPPIVLIMNGTQAHGIDFSKGTNPKKMEKLAKFKEEFRQLHRTLGEDLAGQAKVRVRAVLAGADKSDLKEFVKPLLEHFLANNSIPRSSNMKNVAQIVAEMEKCKDAESAAKHEADQLRKEVEKAETDRKNQEHATKLADQEREKSEKEKKDADARALALKEHLCKTPEEKQRLKDEKKKADEEDDDKRAIAKKKREEADAYWKLGWGALWGSKADAERAADKAEREQKEAFSGYSSKAEALQKAEDAEQTIAEAAQKTSQLNAKQTAAAAAKQKLDAAEDKKNETKSQEDEKKRLAQDALDKKNKLFAQYQTKLKALGGSA